MKSFLLIPRKPELLTGHFENSIKMEFWKKYMIVRRKNKSKKKLRLSLMKKTILQ
jgi:hypothetical protein